ncbi:GNAT family N-acetyltransferase [Sphaerisporangium dianthi]|uniref:GNAT family N-acetyltransferase n=1 Tax=Sphaerisporangium dianthi TaxID=1436120 RepID=A0ABV9CVN1_9ACTN
MSEPDHSAALPGARRRHETAAAQYEEAARRAGVQVRELREIAEFEQVVELFDGIWTTEPGHAPTNVELMIAFSHSGNYVSGAFGDGGDLVGASIGFFAAPSGTALHSHVTGCARGRGIGYALKLHQRAWALSRGLGVITWTYDPLVRRNAYFNIAKLGARPRRYLPSFYGAMEDAINAGDESDRLLAVWRLGDPEAEAACAGAARPPAVPAGAVVALAEQDGRPVEGRVEGRVLLIGTPRDVETLRPRDPATAKAWRHAVRRVLGGLLGEGARVTGFTADGHYIVERP